MRTILGTALLIGMIAPGCREQAGSTIPGKGTAPAESTMHDASRSVPAPATDTSGPKRAEGHILEVEGEALLTPDDLRTLLSREDYRHVAAFQGAKVARDKAMEDFLARKLVVLEARSTGFDRADPLAIQLETVRRSWIANLYEKLAVDNLTVTDREVGARIPKNWEIRTFGEITLESPMEAEKIRNKVVAGEDFEALARELSISPSAPRGGNLRPVDSLTRTVLPEIIDQELWEMPVGGCTPVFSSPLGWGYAFACVRKLEEIPSDQRETYKRAIRDQIRQERVRAVLEGIERTFRKEVDEEAIRNYKDLSPDAVLAKVNGQQVTRRYFEAFYAARPKLTPPATAEGRISELEGILNDLGFYEIAMGLGMDRIPEFRKSYAEYRSGEVVQAYYHRLYGTLKIRDKQVKAFYEENRDKIRQAEGVQARMIVLDSEKEAWDLHGRLDRKEIGFEEAVKNYSTDRNTRKSGGKIGFVSAGDRKIPEVYKVALEVKEGRISPPIDSKGKYYIFKVDERKEDRPLKFGEVKERIRKLLLDKARKDAYDADLKRLKAKYRYRIDEELRASVEPPDAAHGKRAPAKKHP
jgi:parvulin-like peptidyl-prolyl isomerase